METQSNKTVRHHSAGGFVFYESPKNKTLYVALVKKPDGRFFIPKGHIKKRETPEQAATREIMEELSLKRPPNLIAKIGKIEYVFTLSSEKRKHHKEVDLYLFKVDQKLLLKPLKKENFVEARWIKYEEALQKLSFDADHLRQAKKVYLEYKKSPDK